MPSIGPGHDIEWEALAAVARRLHIKVTDEMTSAEISERIALHDKAARPSKRLREQWNDRLRETAL